MVFHKSPTPELAPSLYLYNKFIHFLPIDMFSAYIFIIIYVGYNRHTLRNGIQSVLLALLQILLPTSSSLRGSLMVFTDELP